MAEGIQVESFNAKYFCHHCSHAITPFHMAELICPDCSSGFIEEISKNYLDHDYFSSCDEDSDYEDGTPLSFLPDTMDSLIDRLIQDTVDTEAALVSAVPELGERSLTEPLSSPFFATTLMPSSNGVSYANTRLSSDDYFTTDDELDDLTSQLLDEVTLTGPPPLTKEEIKQLPIICVTDELHKEDIQCTICMEGFILREKAKKLPCSHLYHEKCIRPWLEKQATCPNCRSLIKLDSKDKRSKSCPRYRFSLRNGEDRRFSETSNLSDFLSASMNPFRFLN
ncbi:RING-type E3 ubiquitin transferase [Caerostris darwini]|uniref:RING-type E3 ubiquitin transferase n=1 Tax=Caerostris darwini TaxID=1538125 RepID=A0AAV4NEB8_9ARAC|nr:RING-type E3 ubiquitin transferase [Caerostris darwini]